MISSYFRALTLLLFLSSSYSIAQNNTALLWESELNVNTRFSNRLSFNAGVAYRSIISDDLLDDPLILDSQFFQIAVNLAYDVGFYGKIGGGVMYRFNNLDSKGKAKELRITQQYSYLQNYNSLRIVHRVKTDQRVFRTGTIHRFRYRISGDFPLSGLRLDPGEFYMVLSTESLLNLSRKFSTEWDQRFVAGIGNQIGRKIKLQLDAEYRIEAYNSLSEKRLFLVTNLVYRW